MTEEYPYRECVGCGYCCRSAVCIVGRTRYGNIAAPCPLLARKDGRWRCLAVLEAKGARELHLKSVLAIGAGCCSPLNSDRQEKIKEERNEGT